MLNSVLAAPVTRTVRGIPTELHLGPDDGMPTVCAATFDNLRVRYHPKVILAVHIDTDEGNACDLESATNMELIK